MFPLNPFSFKKSDTGSKYAIGYSKKIAFFVCHDALELFILTKCHKNLTKFVYLLLIAYFGQCPI